MAPVAGRRTSNLPRKLKIVATSVRLGVPLAWTAERTALSNSTVLPLLTSRVRRQNPIPAAAETRSARRRSTSMAICRPGFIFSSRIPPSDAAYKLIGV